MAAESDKRRKRLLVVTSMLVLGSAALLIPSAGFFPHITIVPRIALPAFLLAGLMGAITKVNRLLVIGKIGIWLFILYGIAGLQEPEDIPFPADLKYGLALVGIKCVLFLAVSVGLLLCFRWLGRIRPDVSSS